ncbi:MAG: hypothetical protein SFY80_14875 [Verrucomicrobiota bacterium]|nr:hypothetical protein [Verrucomicrobiota bacterium]
MNPSTNQDYEAFLRDEVSQINRSNRQALFLGAIFAVALIVYMTVILNMIRGFLDPELITNNIAVQIEKQTPVFIADAELNLKLQAPAVAESLSLTFLRAIPALRAEAEQQIDLCHKEMIPHLSLELQEIIRTYILENKDELKAFVDAHRADPDFANQFTSDMLAELGTQLDATMKIDFEGRDITYFKENVMAGLLALNTHLDTLATPNPEKLDYRLRLQRKILASLINKLTSQEFTNNQIELLLPDFLQ